MMRSFLHATFPPPLESPTRPGSPVASSSVSVIREEDGRYRYTAEVRRHDGTVQSLMGCAATGAEAHHEAKAFLRARGAIE